MNKSLDNKLAKLPVSAGVYFHKNTAGEIIYIGKAANLKNRVRQYFQANRFRDPKTDLLVNEIADIDWIEVETEADALFLEAEMVRRYLPPYNILLRDDKSLQFVRIDYKSDYPTVRLIRRPLDDGAQYFGPYINGLAVKKALRYLRRAFPYAISRPAGQKRASLHYHLGLDPGLEDGRTSLADYRTNLRKLMQYLRCERVTLIRDIEKQMKQASKKRDFEKAASLRNQLAALNELNRQVLFSDRELLDASKDQALVELAQLLGLAVPPKKIEGFDISHIQGTDNVASLVVFINGLPSKTDYRKFKMRAGGNNDFAHMREAITRRFSQENSKKWGKPNLILIDGGKGQLSAALEAYGRTDLPPLLFVGLAKRNEEIIVRKANKVVSKKLKVENQVSSLNIKYLAKLGGYAKESGGYVNMFLPENTHIVKLLARIRDESHRFAVSYHSTLRLHRQTASLLDDIPGVGPATRKKLIRHFGSMKAMVQADEKELQNVLGQRSGRSVAKYLSQLKPKNT